MESGWIRRTKSQNGKLENEVRRQSQHDIGSRELSVKKLGNQILGSRHKVEENSYEVKK